MSLFDGSKVWAYLINHHGDVTQFFTQFFSEIIGNENVFLYCQDSKKVLILPYIHDNNLYNAMLCRHLAQSYWVEQKDNVSL